MVFLLKHKHDKSYVATFSRGFHDALRANYCAKKLEFEPSTRFSMKIMQLQIG